METRARTYRYHALGRACLDRDIPLILLGHHEDDEYENMLWRFSQDHSNPAFLTMPKEADIPEIVALYGIRSGGNLKVLPTFGRQPYWQGKPIAFPNRVVGIEDGGLRIARPLLDFSKERIIATCHEFGVLWKEDLSNRDRTLTPRNAIRYMTKNHRLPSALSRSRFLRSRAAFRERSQIIDSLGGHFFNLSDFGLDVRNGTARLTLPNPMIMTGLVNDSKLVKYTGSARISEIVASSLKKVMHILLPNHGLSTLQLATAVNAVISHYAALEQNASKLPFSEFQLSGLKFQTLTHDQVPNEDPQRSQYTWIITKSPFSQKALHAQIFDSRTMAVGDYLDTRIPPQSENHEPEFCNWDRRFWIRVRHHFKQDVWIRPLTKPRLKLIRGLISQKYFDFSIPELNLHAGTEKQLSEVLRKQAPGDVRFTLPVIEGPPLPGGTFTIPIALPTLGIGLTPHGELRKRWNWPADISWEVRYERVDLGPNWQDRLAPEDEEWSWNKPAKAVETPDEEYMPRKIEAHKVINSSDELRKMVLGLREAAVD